jgi:hypothetical protein
MRLVSVTLHGYKRFVSPTKVDLDGSLIAIVGPNEAGKTSILQALLRLDDADPLSASERTRGGDVQDEQVVIDALYLVEPGDRDVLADVYGGGDQERSRWFHIQKLASGEIRTGLLPGLGRDLKPRRASAQLIEKSRKKIGEWNAQGASGVSEIADDSLDGLIEALKGDDARLADATFQALAEVAQALRDIDLTDDSAEELARNLDELRGHEDSAHPNDVARRAMAQLRPRFLFFDALERDLLTEYDLVEVATEPPAALANLARLGGLNLVELRDLLAAGESGEVKHELEQTNRRLKEACKVWTQEEVAVAIDPGDGATIRIHVSNPAGGWSRLEERSDGLKTFVALLALTARDARTTPPVVLIDEAEQHLHYDGQADLIQVLSKQEALAQILYTTHSAGCLPEDLGTGVRIVAPIDATNHSRVVNQFWTEGQGFSPLLLGMGAATLAFVPVRNAVMSEGPSEIILLPSLMREATQLKSLGFQIAPASSNAPPASIGGLDLEAPKVAWLTDGDAGGRQLRRELIAARIPADRIFAIGGERSGLVLEDLVETSVYLAAVNEELRRSGHRIEMPRQRLSKKDRPKSVQGWCEEQDIPPPRKVLVANRIVEQRTAETRLVELNRVVVVRELHSALASLFKLEEAATDKSAT